MSFIVSQKIKGRIYLYRVESYWYLVIATNAQQMDRYMVLHYYRDKEKVEKVFDGVKNHTDGNRLRVHSGYNLEGKLFVRYIAMIQYMYITKVMREKKYLKSILSVR